MKNLEGREFSPAFLAGFRLKSYRLCDISIIRVDTVWMVMETCCQLSRLGTLLTINPHSCARNKLNHSSLTMNHNVASTFFLDIWRRNRGEVNFEAHYFRMRY